MAFMVSPGTVAATPISSSSFVSSTDRPISVNVVGSPTRVVNLTKSATSASGTPSSTSWVRDPMLTFCPCARPCV